MPFRSRHAIDALKQGSIRKLRIEPLEDRHLLAGDFQLLHDVNNQATPVGQDFTKESVVIGDLVFFAADDGRTGTELWKSDGTSEGTVLVKDASEGPKGSAVRYFTALNGVLYYSGTDSHGAELWRSDGTAEGTYLVKDIAAGLSGSSPRDLITFDDGLYFLANEWGSDRLLWKSDGTKQGTVSLALPVSFSRRVDIVGRSPSSLLLFIDSELWATDGSDGGMVLLHRFPANIEDMNFHHLANVGDNFFFSVGIASTGTELWKSDGTVGGTGLVKRVGPAFDADFFVPSAVSTGELLLFSANDGVHGTELWASDGTAEGTFMVKDIRLGERSSLLMPTAWPLLPNPKELANVDGIAYFIANSDSGAELWKSNGTSEGTQRVRAISASYTSFFGHSLVNINSMLYFGARDDAGWELWKSDGTEAGTFRIKDINQRDDLYPTPNTDNSYPTLIISVNGDALFFANDGVHGRELWRTDGTAAGTSLVKDIRPATGDALPRNLTNVDGLLYFVANDGLGGDELWATDGRAHTYRVKDIRPGPEGSSINRLTNVNGTLFFTANDGSLGRGLWKSDGTEEGTSLVWHVTDSTWGSWELMSPMANVGGTLYFTANDGGSGMELWKTDGSAEGTVRVRDINAGPAGSRPTDLIELQGMLFFQANDGTSGSELWKSDGTEAGTVRVKDIRSGSEGSLAHSFTAMDDVLYFTAGDSESGRELWRTDGTEAGTFRVKDIVSGGNGSSPYPLVNANGTLYFTAYAGASRQLWRSDGTDEGTIQLTDVLLATGFSPTIRNITSVGSDVFFVVHESTGGPALWKSDGTIEGTKRVKNFLSDFGPVSLQAWNGGLYFSLKESYRGAKLKLWRSDGTEAGTKEVTPFADDAAIAIGDVYPIVVFKDELLVHTDTIRYGIELWTSNVVSSAPVGDYDASGIVDGADFLAWQRGFGDGATPAGSGADGDGSGAVDAEDLSVWAEHFGEGDVGGGAAAVVAEDFAAQTEIGEAPATAVASLEAFEEESSRGGSLAAGSDSLGWEHLATGELASLAQREASGREALGGRAWDRAAVRREMVAEASSPRRAVAASLDAAFALLGTSVRSDRLASMTEVGEFDLAAEGDAEPFKTTLRRRLDLSEVGTRR